MNQELLAFDKAIDEALGYLSGAEGELSDLNEECEGNFSEVQEALSRFEAARTALERIREPLKRQIKAAEGQHEKEERLYGDA